MPEYEELDRRVLALWREIKHICGNIARKGWRPAFCWAGVFVLWYAYIDAPKHGIIVDLSAVNMLATILLGAFVTRGVEKVQETKAGFNGGIMGPGAATGEA